nr:unnamed protein product [Callosobruchus analis]
MDFDEFKFWYSVTKSTIIGFTCTFFECFNIPVFWPILVMYFITLFCITMKRQIRVCLINYLVGDQPEHFYNHWEISTQKLLQFKFLLIFSFLFFNLISFRVINDEFKPNNFFVNYMYLYGTHGG